MGGEAVGYKRRSVPFYCFLFGRSAYKTLCFPQPSGLASAHRVVRRRLSASSSGTSSLLPSVCVFDSFHNPKLSSGSRSRPFCVIIQVGVSAMETASVENSQSASIPGKNGHHVENSVPDPQHDREMEPNDEISEEEATRIMEVIAATGKFWHHWDMLRRLLSSRLKQVLAEYPEAQTAADMIGPRQSSLSGETYPELVKRLDEALLAFVEGPPFTLQRLCEILLSARSIYPNLSKLALALEKRFLFLKPGMGRRKKIPAKRTGCLLVHIPRQPRALLRLERIKTFGDCLLAIYLTRKIIANNLLVTSTLTMSTDPYPLSTKHKAVEQEKESNKPEPQPNHAENGTEAMSNGDEEMVDAEVEEEKLHENENKEMETKDEMMAPANEVIKTSPEPVSIAKPADPAPSNEQLNQTSS